MTLDQVQLKSVCAKFHQIGQNPKEEFEKAGSPVFAILRKNVLTGSGLGQSQRDSAPFRESGDTQFLNVRHTVWELKATMCFPRL